MRETSLIIQFDYAEINNAFRYATAT